VCKSFIKIEQTGSPIRRHHRQRETLIGLGLNRIGRVTHVPNTPQTRGMIAKVKHLVRVVHESYPESRIDEAQISPRRTSICGSCPRRFRSLANVVGPTFAERRIFRHGAAC
jgi:large subunit ribosomal protein L30